MFCPRLRHFVRLNFDGTIGKCGHMMAPPGFRDMKELDESKWLQRIEDQMSNGEWPDECRRCQIQESLKGESVRTKSISRHNILKPKRDDYLIVGGVLDNICNSACQSCNSNLSTKIGSLEQRDYKRINNTDRFFSLPQHRILEIDVNGGEPTTSPNYKKLISQLPGSVKIVRINTNGSRMINELEFLLARGIMVIVTLSLDGTGPVHDYVRWPIKWKNYNTTVDEYVKLSKKIPLLKLDFWTTVSALNINNFMDIIDYAKSKSIPHDYAPLYRPHQLDISYKNFLTEDIELSHPIQQKVGTGKDNSDDLIEFINRNDRLRGINIKDYLNF